MTCPPMGSVASFFVSRVDTEVDARLDKIGTAEAATLRGRAAIANAQLAYEQYERVFNSPRWAALEAAGARPQRPLWASTSVKDPAYPDTRYVTGLVAPGVVNTMPEATLRAVADHGVILAGLGARALHGGARGAQPAAGNRHRLRRGRPGPRGRRGHQVRRQLAASGRAAHRQPAAAVSTDSKGADMSRNNAYVIAGASLAGAKAAEALRAEGFGGPVILIGEEEERPYERPPLSKDYLLGKAERETIYVHPAGVVRRARRQPAAGGHGHGHRPRRARGDPGRRQPGRLRQAAAGHRLLAAPAGVPGADRDGVLYLRRVEDSDRIKEAFQAASRVAVIGGRLDRPGDRGRRPRRWR